MDIQEIVKYIKDQIEPLEALVLAQWLPEKQVEADEPVGAWKIRVFVGPWKGYIILSPRYLHRSLKVSNPFAPIDKFLNEYNDAIVTS